jgi:hypothetical protein
VSSPGWTDDELLHELRAALQESTVDESVIRAAQAAFTWRTVDTELELLSLDASSGRLAGSLVRGSGPGDPGGAGTPRMLVFQADEVGCFAFPPPASGPLRLDCRIGADHFVTDWVTV